MNTSPTLNELRKCISIHCIICCFAYLISDTGIKLPTRTYMKMIVSEKKFKKSKETKYSIASLIKSGQRPTPGNYGSLLDYYAKTGRHITELIDLVKNMKDTNVMPNIQTWGIIMNGFSRAKNETDRKKALSIWMYLSGKILYESLDIDLPRKAPNVVPNVVTLNIALDVCKFGRFEKEAHEIWMYGQESDFFLDPNLLTSYVECLATFGKEGADRVVELIELGIKGEGMPLRNVRPDSKTMRNAIGGLVSKGRKEHSEHVAGIRAMPENGDLRQPIFALNGHSARDGNGVPLKT
jgi:hypothetical protein